MGAGSGTTTINNALTVDNNVTLNTTLADSVTINGRTDFVNADITIRDAGGFGISIGRGGGEVQTNTRVGYAALNANQSGIEDVAFGYSALQSCTAGSKNSAFGHRALLGKPRGWR